MNAESDSNPEPHRWRRLWSSPVASAPSRRNLRALLPAVIAAAALATWIILYQLQAFLGLETTSDPYVVAQLATSWLEGRPLHDHFFGNQLAAHSFLIAPALSPFVLVGGVPGLLVAGSLAAALSLFAIYFLLRAHAVPPGPALGWAVLSGAMPLSLHAYLDMDYGFHLELLIPALGLWLAYFLSRRQAVPAVVLAILLLLVKEDATLICALIALMIGMEDFIRGTAATPGRWNRPACAVLGLAVAALPLLLALIESAGRGQASNLDRIRLLHSTNVSSSFGLPAFLLANAGDWLASPTVRQWFGLALASTFGLALLRPHFLLVGLLTSVVAWLLKDDLLWPARFAGALTFFQLAGALAFASFVRLVRTLPLKPAARAIGLAFGCVAVGCSLHHQLRLLPRIGAGYLLAPQTRATAEERAIATGVFARYAELRRPGESVVASPMLFRFAAVRDLRWLRPFGVAPTAPTWILWDRKDQPLARLWAELHARTGRRPEDYELIEQAAQFYLFRAKPR